VTTWNKRISSDTISSAPDSEYQIIAVTSHHLLFAFAFRDAAVSKYAHLSLQANIICLLLALIGATAIIRHPSWFGNLPHGPSTLEFIAPQILTSSEVAARAVSPARRFLPASRKSFDQR
jgi:hypothetical protein